MASLTHGAIAGGKSSEADVTNKGAGVEISCHAALVPTISERHAVWGDGDWRYAACFQTLYSVPPTLVHQPGDDRPGPCRHIRRLEQSMKLSRSHDEDPQLHHPPCDV